MFPSRTPIDWIPGIRSLRSYRKTWLTDDLVAGLSLTALLVPQGMAYAQLAGLPAVTGLYTTVLSLLAYALFGPSRILVLGPDSSLGPLIAATILPLVGAGGEPGKAIALAGALALMMGLICIAAGMLRAGTVAQLLSKPVRIGYLNGIAVVVLAGQLPKLFGFGVDGDHPLSQLWSFFRGLGQTSPAALAIGLSSLFLILGVRRWRPRLPAVLLAVVGATLAVILFDLEGVSLVGAVPAGFPTISFPAVAWDEYRTLFLAAAGMAFVTLTDTSALSRAFATEAGDHVDPNQEIAALGLANVAAGLFSGFPLSASSSRTAVAKTAGAHTQLVGVIGAVAIMILLVFANDLTERLPTAALAAIVIVAGLSLLDVAEMRWLWTARRTEFFLCLAALLGVVIIGVLEGIVVAILLSLSDFVRRAWRPHDAELGRVAGRKGYHDLGRHPEADQVPGLVLYRFDAPLFFANAEFFGDRIRQILARHDAPVKWVVVAAEPVTDVDTTGAEILERLMDELEAGDVRLGFAALKGPVKDRLRRYGLYDRVGEEMMFPTVGSAVSGFLAATGTKWADPLGEREPSPGFHPNEPGRG